MAVARSTISLDPGTMKTGIKRAKALGYKSFSAYCEHLIKKDVEERPAHVTVREEAGQYSAKRGDKRRMVLKETLSPRQMAAAERGRR